MTTQTYGLNTLAQQMLVRVLEKRRKVLVLEKTEKVLVLEMMVLALVDVVGVMVDTLVANHLALIIPTRNVSKTPRIMEAMVSPSIQPLAFTNWDAGNSSVRMPYLAGE